MIQNTLDRLVEGGLLEVETQGENNKYKNFLRGRVANKQYFLTEEGRRTADYLEKHYKSLEL